MDDPRPTAGPRSLAGTARALFAHGSPRLLAAQLLVAVAARPLLGPLGAIDALIVATVIVYWPIQEWVLHRVVLHARPRQLGPFRFDSAAARAHRRHHREPRDPTFTVLPTSTVLLLIPLHLTFWWAVTPSTAAAGTGVIAFGAAALVYEWIHFLCHAPYRPRSAYLRRVRAHHALHHFKSERYWHSFTVPSLDRLLGTGPQPSTVAQSPSCRDLGIRDE